MKIIFLGPAHPYRGGPASFSDRLAQQFITEGHDAEIFTFRLQYPGFLFPGKTQYTDNPAPAGVKITRLLNSVNPLNWIMTGFRIKRLKPDILLLRFWLPFMGPSLGTVARIVKMNKHTRVICIFDNVVPHEKRTGDRLLTRYFTGSIDAAVVMSKSVGEDLKKFNDRVPVRLSPHPVFDNYGAALTRDDSINALSLDGSFSYMLFFGFIRAYKGLDILLEALADERLRNKKLKLIVAGEFYEDAAPYRDLIKRNGLENDVIIFDRFIRDEEVASLFGAADLIVQPYRSATQSGVTQVAYHFNKPMLVTDVGGLSEIVSHGRGGYVVKPDVKEIADSIFDFFENNRKQEFTEGVIREKDKFSWDKMTKAIADVYKECQNPVN
jgi:glycosyltransferase involved in cell wall biosynthesis